MCLAFARSSYKRLLRDEHLGTIFDRADVYLLTGPARDSKYRQRLYVGEDVAFRLRLDQHYGNKRFWEQCFVLTTTDTSLDESLLLQLEDMLLHKAEAAGTIEIDNSPKSRTRQPVSAAKKSEAATFLDTSLRQFPLLGCSIFDAPAGPRAGHTNSRSASGGPQYRFVTALTNCLGRPSLKGFTVRKGSLARANAVASMREPNRRLRQALMDEGVLVPYGDQQLRLARDHEFNSPSQAASVMCAGNRNGLGDWKDDNGHRLAPPSRFHQRLKRRANAPSKWQVQMSELSLF
ncbi:hypothetical protein DBP19_21970 [Streptomyces sp. CS090A]|nr:hypothetical protein DBP19_21970 [Streptomyces sp. CS090A]